MHSSPWFDVLPSYIDEKKIVELTCQLIEKKTINPPGNEYLVEDVLTRSFEELGARVETYEPAQGRCNFLGYVGEGKPVVAIISHMDVVPAGEEEWESDPFSPQIKEGKIYGRGAIDNKGPYAASWAAVKAILSASLPFEGTIVLGAVADEERGSKNGMEYLLDKGFTPDFCIIPDGGKLNQLVVGEKGRMEVLVQTGGKSAHASQPERGENAIYKMADYILGLQKLKIEGNCHHLFAPSTINLGQIQGGQAPNVVADRCLITLDIRYPLGIEEEDIISQLKNLASRNNIDIKVLRGDSIGPHLIEEKNPLVQLFKNTADKLELNLSLSTQGGITIAKNLFFRGIPGVVHSPSTDSVAHQANEYVEIKHLTFCANLWAGVIYSLLKKSE